MATVLYKLGRFSYRRRGAVVIVWLFVLALAGAGAATLKSPTSSAFSIPGTESQRATELLSQSMPQAAADGASAQVVFLADGSARLTDPRAAAAITRVTEQLKQQPTILSVQDALTSKQIAPDARTAFTSVTYKVSPLDLTDADHEALLRIGRDAQSAGLTVEFTGDAVADSGGDPPVEAIGIAVAAIV